MPLDLTDSNKQTAYLDILEQIHDSQSMSILVVDSNKKVIFVSENFKKFFSKECTHDELSLSCSSLFKNSCCDIENKCPLVQSIEQNKVISFTHQLSIEGRKDKFIKVTMTPIYDYQEKVFAYVESRHDISEQVMLHARLKDDEYKLKQQVNLDTLTNLANRRSLMQHLDQVISEATNKDYMIGLLFLDLDNFKTINDTLGHAIGDQVLQITAKRIKRLVRETDMVARLGGDEFVIVIDEIQKPEDASLLAQKIIDTQNQMIHLNQHSLYMKSSIGISLYPGDSSNAEMLLQHADLAMYQSKQTGRNSYSFFNTQLIENSIERIYLENDLNKAIVNNELIIHYQSQVDVKTNQLTGMEALIRWQHPTKGVLLPQQFIPIAEQSNLIEDIGEWLLLTVCKQISTWLADGKNPGRVAVNLAGRQVLHEDLLDNVLRILDKSKCPAENLEFKITEGFIPKLTENAINVLKELRNLGVELSIDDFGKGYSSLAFLKRLPISRLKIDRSFIQQDEANEEIAKAIIALGKSLNLKVIAEGVEDQTQQKLLSRVGCQEARGYFYGKPMDTDAMTSILNKLL